MTLFEIMPPYPGSASVFDGHPGGFAFHVRSFGAERQCRTGRRSVAIGDLLGAYTTCESVIRRAGLMDEDG